MTHLDVVFDGAPGPEGPRFIEVEDEQGASVSAGSWVDRGDGTWALRLERPILPGDLVEHRSKPELDEREVVSVGRDFLTLNLLGRESTRLPLDNYRVTRPREGVL
jgi:hypothetical protein